MYPTVCSYSLGSADTVLLLNTIAIDFSHRIKMVEQRLKVVQAELHSFFISLSYNTRWINTSLDDSRKAVV